MAGLAWDQPRLPLPGGCQKEEEEERRGAALSPCPLPPRVPPPCADPEPCLRRVTQAEVGSA